MCLNDLTEIKTIFSFILFQDNPPLCHSILQLQSSFHVHLDLNVLVKDIELIVHGMSLKPP